MPKKVDQQAAQKPAVPTRIMGGKYPTAYDQNRDPFYGLERDPHTRKVHDAR